MFHKISVLLLFSILSILIPTLVIKKIFYDEEILTPTELLILARNYHYGRGSEKDISNAINFYRDSAKAGNTEAMYELGLLYNSEASNYKDKSKALYWLGEANNHNVLGSACNIAQILGESFDGSDRKKELITDLFKTSLKRGYGESKYEYSRFLIEHGDESDLVLAETILLSVSDPNDSDVLFLTGKLYVEHDDIFHKQDIGWKAIIFSEMMENKQARSYVDSHSTDQKLISIRKAIY